MKRSKMPPRKEPKEQVVYAASKRKAPPFKPQRPSQVPRVPTTGSESSRAGASRKPSIPAKRKPPPAKIVDESSEDDDASYQGAAAPGSDSDLENDPLAAQPTKPSKLFKPPAGAAKRNDTRALSPMDISSDDGSTAAPSRPQSATADHPAGPSPTEQPFIPQPLLIRLLHEHFSDLKTKIDKHAIQVLSKYLEVFVQETVARAQLQKREDAEKAGAATDVDVDWLELDDLDKVAPAMMLDF